MSQDIEQIEKLRRAGLSESQIQMALGGLQTSNDTMNVRQVETDPYVEIKGLPSGGRYYKNNFGIPVKLKGMPLKVRDAIALEAMEMSNDTTVLDDIFAKRISGVTPGEILVGDELYIKAWLREQTFSRTPLIKTFECEKCSHLNEDKVVGLEDLIIYYLPDKITDPMEETLPISKDVVRLRFMRRKDRTRIENHVRENDAFRKLTPADIKIYEIASVMFGMSITDAVEYLENLDPTDFAVINTFFIKMNFGFVEKAFLKCEKEECGFSSIIPVPFQSGFFLPQVGPDLSNQS